MESISILEEPLRGTPYRPTTKVEWKKPKSLKGPKKAVRLILLCIIMPGIFLAVPLYLKHRVYDYQVYPVGLSDMRLIDNRVSTTWCQRQLVKANQTFNAFLMPATPHVARERKTVSMTRHLLLSDDMKEYWGFYLLKGSTVTVSTCSRWPGASLILIRGHRHLHECAYIGDDSSEELEELMEIAAEKGVIENFPDMSADTHSNRFDLLTKHRPEVQFHDPVLKQKAETYTFKPPITKLPESDEQINTKQMKELLSILSYKSDKMKISANKPKLSDENRQAWSENLSKLLLETQKEHVHMKRGPNFGNEEEENIKFEKAPNANPTISTTSYEDLENILTKLKLMGPKGKRVLALLKDQDLSTPSDTTAAANKDNVEVEKIALDKPNNNNNNTTQEKEKEASAKSIKTSEEELLRAKRELILSTALGQELNEDNEDENLAIEEGYEPDGIADHHHVLNQSTLNDRSNSEFWSSFSSSEEALLNCAGLILSLPLNPHRQCERNRHQNDFNEASSANKITYSVPTNGYYFFVFSSENEVQENYIRVDFDLQKTMYNVTNPVNQCNNSTEQCALPLRFFSNEKVVFELPVDTNETLWNEEFMVVSECEPRTVVYLICVLSVPLLILMFAFQ